MNAPSEKRLMDAFGIDSHKANLIRTVIKSKFIKTENFPKTSEWISKCYHRPSWSEIAMECINEILEGYGVEAHFPNESLRPSMTFVNFGDTYAPTIVYSYRTHTFKITTWGDEVERI